MRSFWPIQNVCLAYIKLTVLVSKGALWKSDEILKGRRQNSFSWSQFMLTHDLSTPLAKLLDVVT